MLEKCEKYSTGYDVKVFVLGFSNILMDDNMKFEVKDKLPIILDFIVTLLKK